MFQKIWGLLIIPLLLNAEIESFESLPPEVVFPPGGKVTVSYEGDYLVNGRYRYLLGTQVAAATMEVGFTHTSGYGSEYNWIYDEPLTYQSSQRLGFDTYALFVPHAPWLQTILPNYKQFGWNLSGIATYRKFMTNGLPILVDVTCFSWSFGLLADERNRPETLPEEALLLATHGEMNHMMAYNPVHPDGRKIYLDYWKFYGDYARNDFHGNQPIVFELMNEPAYDAPGPYTRHAFLTFLKIKYGTVEVLNRTWRTSYKSFEEVIAFDKHYDCLPLNVDWSKFLEGTMTSLAKEGHDEVKKHLPEALVCYQMMGADTYWWLPNTHINIYEINRYMDAISTSTGGGIISCTGLKLPPVRSLEAPSNSPILGEGIIQRHYYRSMAGTKPLHNPECYTGTSRHDKYIVPWLDFLRGANATYMFSWGKRSWEWNPQGTPEGGKKIAEKFPYILANPYAHAPESLAGFMDAKKEICAFSWLFGPRQQRVKGDIALLLSFATTRYAEKTDYVEARDMYGYGSALEFSHFPYDVIVEEQLPEKKAEDYRLLLAVGVRNTLPATDKALEDFVRQGGTLVAARQLMAWDEYGNERPKAVFEGLSLVPLDSVIMEKLELQESLATAELRNSREIVVRSSGHLTADSRWEVMARCNGKPAIVKRSLGAGTVYVIVPSMTENVLAEILESIAVNASCCRVTRIVRAEQGDREMNIEAHQAKAEGVTGLSLINLDAYPKLSWVEIQGEAVVDARNKRRLPVQDGRVLVYFPTNAHVILASGSPETLRNHFGECALQDEAQSRLAYQQHYSEHLAGLEALSRNNNCYDCDRALTRAINLRGFVNTDFKDDVISGNGKGGWLDLGKDGNLDNTPWEEMDLLGIPCDFIRHDANNEKTCLVMKAQSCIIGYPEKVTGIPVMDKVKSLYVFGAVSGGRPGETAMTMVVHYENGNTLNIPFVCGESIDDWRLPPSSPMAEHVAWKNTSGRGFYLRCWRNPQPNIRIRDVDFISSVGSGVPFVVGLTKECVKAGTEVYPVILETGVTWGQSELKLKDDRAEVVISEKTSNWSGLRFKFSQPLTLSHEQMARGELVFEINGGKDLFGNHRGGQSLQIKCPTKFMKMNMDIDANSRTFQTIHVPLQRWCDKSKEPFFDIKDVSFQFVGTGKVAGYQLRNIRIEVPAAVW